MNAMERIGRVRMLTPHYQNRKLEALEFIREAFSIADKPYLALSAGKDSVAMLALVNEIALENGIDFPLWIHISDASFPGTLETAKRCSKISGRDLIIDQSPVSAFDVIREKITPFGKKGYFFDAIKNFVIESGHDLAFIGVRARESPRRMRAVKIHKHLFRSSVAGDRWICYPLAWFYDEDVCAAIVEYGYPFHPIYNKRHPSGNPLKIRLGYVTAQDLLNKGSMVFLKTNYPEIYNRLISSDEKYGRYL